MLAHGALLRKNFFSASDLVAIVRDFRHAGLSEEEVAIMEFVQKISVEAQQISENDFIELRKFGLADKEILDIVSACTARIFFSKTLDALNAAPDEVYLELEPELREVLVLGRPFT
jgi:alkylhydroperoxidase family enzyme